MNSASFDMPPAPASFERRGGWVVRALMRDLDLLMNAAGGIAGNIGFESGGFTKLHEIGQPAGRGGYGWGQWTADRRVTFLAYCKMHSLDWHDDEANYGYLVDELRGPYKATVAALKRLGSGVTLSDAVWSVGQTYERPGGTTDSNLPGFDDRLHWARRAVNGAAAAAPLPVAPPVPIAPSVPVSPIPSAGALQAALAVAGFYKAKVDNDWGELSAAALSDYYASLN